MSHNTSDVLHLRGPFIPSKCLFQSGVRVIETISRVSLIICCKGLPELDDGTACDITPLPYHLSPRTPRTVKSSDTSAHRSRFVWSVFCLTLLDIKPTSFFTDQSFPPTTSQVCKKGHSRIRTNQIYIQEQNSCASTWGIIPPFGGLSPAFG